MMDDLIDRIIFSRWTAPVLICCGLAMIAIAVIRGGG